MTKVDELTDLIERLEEMAQHKSGELELLLLEAVKEIRQTRDLYDGKSLVLPISRDHAEKMNLVSERFLNSP